LRICLASSEVAPLAKTGGLADVSAALAKYLTANGHDVRLFLPFYSTIDLKDRPVHPVEFLQNVPLSLGGQLVPFSVYTTRLAADGPWVYLISCAALYDREGIYPDDGDDHLRFAYFSRAVIESCQRMGWAPQVFHCNDWHTALIPLYLKTLYSWDRVFSKTKTVLTLHNVAYQGVFSAAVLPQLDLEPHAALLHQDDLHAGAFGFLRSGILYADVLSTVSPTHAREICTPEHGKGQDAMLRARRGRLVGILNGVDYSEWSPENDPLIPHPYSVDDLSGKEKNKQALVEGLGLPYHPRLPVLGIVSRLAVQKGFDLLFETLPAILARGHAQLVVLGTGEPRYERFFSGLQARFPSLVCFYRGYSNELAHKIEAGADLFLMPSRYEPCGLNQMYSLRYGTPPIVHKTGGLADTVTLYDPKSGKGTGFPFDHFTPEGFQWSLERALKTYADPARWRALQLNGMRLDFSWERQIGKYETLYTKLLGQ